MSEIIDRIIDRVVTYLEEQGIADSDMRLEVAAQRVLEAFPDLQLSEPDALMLVVAALAQIETRRARTDPVSPVTDQDHDPSVRFTCANWTGDAYTGHHTGPCGSKGYLDVPAELALAGAWKRWVIDPRNTREGWSVTSHWCNEAGDHDINADSRFHDNEHEMLFCCGPCMLEYLLLMYFPKPSVDRIIASVKEAARG